MEDNSNAVRELSRAAFSIFARRQSGTSLACYAASHVVWRCI